MNVTATMEAVTSLAPTGRGLSHAAVAVATHWILMGAHAMVWFSVSSRGEKPGASFLCCVQICFPLCLPGSIRGEHLYGYIFVLCSESKAPPMVYYILEV